jgi:hypothetical protein
MGKKGTKDNTNTVDNKEAVQKLKAAKQAKMKERVEKRKEKNKDAVKDQKSPEQIKEDIREKVRNQNVDMGNKFTSMLNKADINQDFKDKLKDILILDIKEILKDNLVDTSHTDREQKMDTLSKEIRKLDTNIKDIKSVTPTKIDKIVDTIKDLINKYFGTELKKFDTKKQEKLENAIAGAVKEAVIKVKQAMKSSVQER